MKNRDITLLTKVHIVKAMVFPVFMYWCESWTKKKTECQRTDTFELYWRRLLRVPWTARRSNQSILKEINPENSLEELMLKQKLQYFGHLMRRTDSLEKTLMLGKTEGKRRRGQDEIVRQHHWLNGHEFVQTPVDSERQGNLGVLQFMGSLRVKIQLRDWTATWQCHVSSSTLNANTLERGRTHALSLVEWCELIYQALSRKQILKSGKYGWKWMR